MGYELRFQTPDGEIVPLGITRHSGFYCSGLNTKAIMGSTYNYDPYFRRVFGPSGIEYLYGKTALEVIKELNAVLLEMDFSSRTMDYWEATEGNAALELNNLRSLAQLVPRDAVLQGD